VLKGGVVESGGRLGAEHLSVVRNHLPSSSHFLVHVLSVVVEVLFRLDGWLLNEPSEVLWLVLSLGHGCVPNLYRNVVSLRMLESNRIYCVFCIGLCEQVLRLYARHMPSVPGNVLLANLVVWSRHPVYSIFTVVAINIFVWLVSLLMLLRYWPIEALLVSAPNRHSLCSITMSSCNDEFIDVASSHCNLFKLIRNVPSVTW